MSKFRFVSLSLLAVLAGLFLAMSAQAAPPPYATEIDFEPGMLAGGPVTIEASGQDDVRWILPGPRALDPAIFGTPDQPLGFEPGTGVPLEARLISEDGSAYTTTAGPTPFSDSYAPSEGSLASRWLMLPWWMDQTPRIRSISPPLSPGRMVRSTP